jgi:hypothetical protein
MTSFILKRMLSYPMSGEKLSYFISAISSATCQYILSVSTVNSTNIALGPGAGTQTGRVVGLSSFGMGTLIYNRALSSGFSGRELRRFCNAISYGVVMAMKSVVIQGSIIGAGPGTGTGTITGLVPSALQGIMYSQEAFRLISGDKLRTILSAIAFGICNHIMAAGKVNVTDIGVAASPPVGPITIPAAPGIGKLV